MSTSPTEEQLLLALLKKLLGGIGKDNTPQPIHITVNIDGKMMTSEVVKAIEGEHGLRTIQPSPR